MGALWGKKVFIHMGHKSKQYEKVYKYQVSFSLLPTFVSFHPKPVIILQFFICISSIIKICFPFYYTKCSILCTIFWTSANCFPYVDIYIYTTPAIFESGYFPTLTIAEHMISLLGFSQSGSVTKQAGLVSRCPTERPNTEATVFHREKRLYLLQGSKPRR